MFLITHSIIVMSSLTFVLGLVYYYMYLQNFEGYMGFWGLSWIIYSLSFIFDFWKFSGQDSSIFIIEKQGFYLISSLLFLFATYDFFGYTVPKFWSYFSIISILFVIGSLMFSPLFLPLTLHTSIFLCFISVWNGLLFIIYAGDINTEERYLTGFMFILWGIYKGYYPFIQPKFWLSPWSYVGGAILINILSILMLLIHFKKNKSELSKREKRFRLLAENARDCIYLYRFYPSPKFEYVSPAVYEIIGYTPEELYKNPKIFFQQVHPDDCVTLENALKKTCTSQSEPIILRWIRRDGTMVWGEQHHTIICDKDGNTTAIEGILRDITDRKQVEENLFRLEKSRRDLITNISHELRTPITLIQGYVESMVDGVVSSPEDNKKYLNLIHSRVLGLNRLIHDLFQLTQLESREIDFQLYQISIHHLLLQIYNKYELDVRNGGLNFEIHIPSGIFQSHKEKDGPIEIIQYSDLTVAVDFDRIEQVFSNIIFNSVKHTPPGGTIKIDYDIVPYTIGLNSHKHMDYDDDPSMDQLPRWEVIIGISDNGWGIDPNDLPHIFDRFYKGNKSPRNSFGSRGLGLAIAKEIIEYHGGRIWAVSQPNKGSTFYFTLPITS